MGALTVPGLCWGPGRAINPMGRCAGPTASSLTAVEGQLLGTGPPSIPFQTNTCLDPQELYPRNALSCREKLISLLDSQNGSMHTDKISPRHEIRSDDHMEPHRPVGRLPGGALTACGLPYVLTVAQVAEPSAEAMESLKARSKLFRILGVVAQM